MTRKKNPRCRQILSNNNQAHYLNPNHANYNIEQATAFEITTIKFAVQNSRFLWDLKTITISKVSFLINGPKISTVNQYHKVTPGRHR